MSLLLRFTVFLAIIFSCLAAAQDFQYKVIGTFPTKATTTPTAPATVEYSITWNENSNTIQGLYQDNYFSKSGALVVTGTKNSSGRGFNIILPEPVNGVKSITMTSPQLSESNGSIQMNLTTKDSLDAGIDSTIVFSNMSLQSNFIPGTNSQGCTVGFGVLAGFCGLYTGSLNEISDQNERCNLTSLGQVRLELATNSQINLYLRFANSIEGSPVHRLGTIPQLPQAGNVATSSKVCAAPLEGTSLATENCKDQVLTGVFFNQAGVKSFTGNYTITDEKTRESCSYSLTFTQASTY